MFTPNRFNLLFGLINAYTWTLVCNPRAKGIAHWLDAEENLNIVTCDSTAPILSPLVEVCRLYHTHREHSLDKLEACTDLLRIFNEFVVFKTLFHTFCIGLKTFPISPLHGFSIV